MTDGAEGFELGQGRARPAYKPKPLECAQCGASIELKDERARVIVCQYCSTQIELTATEATAIGVVNTQAPDFELPIGAAFDWEGVRYEVVGRIGRINPDEPEDAWNHDFLLYNPRHPALWLSSYERDWSLDGRTRVLPAGDVFSLPPGGMITTHDGRSWRVVEREVSQIAYVDGALPWLARVGDRTKHVALLAIDGSGETFEAEYNAHGELEYSRGKGLSINAVKRATSGRVKLRAIDADSGEVVLPRTPGAARARVISNITFGWAALCILTGLVFMATGETVARGSLPPEGGRVGPITVTEPGTVLDVGVRQSFRVDGWSYVEGEVQDEEGEYLFGFGEELWAESGYDGGAWHEEYNDFDLKVTIPQPGTYYLAFKAQGQPQQSARSPFGVNSAANNSAASTPPPTRGTNVLVQREAGSSLPFFIAGVLALGLGVAIRFFVAANQTMSS